MDSKILIKNVEVIDQGPEYPKMNIGITGSKITAISTAPLEGYADAKVIDGTDKIAAPGMVNAHTHAAMTLLRSYGDDMNLQDWLTKKVWPAEAKLNNEDIYWGTMLAILEMLKTGTTTFADMYYFMDDVAKAAQETGIRCSLSRGLLDAGQNDAEEKLAENVALYKKWHLQADGRIRIMMGPHAPYTCSPAYLKKIKAEADKLGSEIHMHLAETKTEFADCMKTYGMTPIKFADSFGFMENGLLAAHCVHVTDEDIELMAKKKVRVAHNPQSNLKLASGIAPITKMLDHNICVALGTDGTSSNNNLDMLEECRAVAMLQKGITYDPLAVPARTALKMATESGAQALGFKHLGKLAPGYLADIVLYDMNKPHWHPRHDRQSLLVYAADAADTDTVIINGKLLLQQGKPLYMDEEKIYAECEASSQHIIGK